MKKELESKWLNLFASKQDQSDWWTRKKKLCRTRGIEIVRMSGKGHLFRKVYYDQQTYYSYLLYLTILLKQADFFYMEEQVVPFQYRFENGKIIDHTEQIDRNKQQSPSRHLTERLIKGNDDRRGFSYNPRAAVRYAEYWWNSYNPEFPKFAVDCTNYVSQCLLAGGAPMRGEPIRDQGWWYQDNNWSFSWSVAHSMRWYLAGSMAGLQGKEVQTAKELSPGDIICYDFQGDGRWDHNTIVVNKDRAGMPLVNAHTDNSRNRYWSYEDSAAWTPEIKYKLFRIGQ